MFTANFEPTKRMILYINLAFSFSIFNTTMPRLQIMVKHTIKIFQHLQQNS